MRGRRTKCTQAPVRKYNGQEERRTGMQCCRLDARRNARRRKFRGLVKNRGGRHNNRNGQLHYSTVLVIKIAPPHSACLREQPPKVAAGDSPTPELAKRGPNRDGAATGGTDAAYPSASGAPVVWAKWDVTAVTPTSGIRKRRRRSGKREMSQGPR